MVYRYTPHHDVHNVPMDLLQIISHDVHNVPMDLLQYDIPGLNICARSNGYAMLWNQQRLYRRSLEVLQGSMPTVWSLDSEQVSLSCALTNNQRDEEEDG